MRAASKLYEVMLALVQAKASPRVDVDDFEVEDGSKFVAAAAFVGDLHIGCWTLDYPALLLRCPQ